MTESIERIVSALQYIPSDDRDNWVKAGMAIHSELGDDMGFDLWDNWSQQADSYRPADARAVWKGFKPGGGVTIATLFKIARDNGWRDDQKWTQPDAAAMAEFNRLLAEKAKQGRKQIAAEQEQTAQNAAAILTAAVPATADNPYLVRKGVPPVDTLREIDTSAAVSILGYSPKSGGDLLTGRLLVVPVKRDGAITTLELIDGDKRKTALAGSGTKAGGYWATKRLPDGDGTDLTLLIGEGVATVLSVSEANRFHGVAALSCSNMGQVARTMREQYPAATIIVLADLDKTTGLPDHHAAKAAADIGGKLAAPSFTGERQQGQTDFNDLHQAEGLEAVCASVERAIVPPAPQQAGQPEQPGSDDSGEITAAIERLAVDAGAVFVPHILDSLKQARKSDPAAWARYRQAIKASSKVAMGDLDRLTTPDSDDDDSAAVAFEDVEPWSDPVNGADLLDQMTATIKQYVVADDPTIRMAALWSVMTWFMDVVSVSPIANITAPEKRCGKSVLLGVIQRLSYKPITTSNIATAALYRCIELWHPTLLIDEVDSFLRDNEDARGILNSGFNRDGAYVVRCVGDDHTPTRFSTWAAKALCGIGKLADTLQDRSIPLHLRRKMPGEVTANLRHADPQHFDTLSRKLARFALDNRETIRTARPARIDGLNDRANDCMEPLLAIAGAAGGDWPESTRRDALHLFGLEEEPVSANVELLISIEEAFSSEGEVKLFTDKLLELLTADLEAPWATWNKGKAMTARQLAKKVGEFGIKPNTIRIGAGTKKGYSLDQFKDAFKRYIPVTPPPSPPDPPILSVTTSQPSNGAGFSHFSSVTPASNVTDEKQLQPSNGAGCDVVTDRNTPPAGKGGGNGVVTDGSAPPAAKPRWTGKI